MALDFLRIVGNKSSEDFYEDEDGEDGNDDFCENEVKQFASEFHQDVKMLARQYMEHFFKDKMLYCGGKIPKSLLFSEHRISMVLNYDISQGVQYAYRFLEKEMDIEEIEESRQTGETTNDIKLVNETLNLLAVSGIPQQFAGGMMCLYLEFIEGVDFCI